MERLILGCGYVGQRVAERWTSSGDRVYTVTRSEQRAERFREQGFEPLVQDLAEAWKLGELPAVDTVLFAVGFDRSGKHAMREVYVDGLRAVLEHLSTVGRFVYVSSTGVYGDAEGEEVTEETACHPQREGGQLCLEAEQMIRQHEVGKQAVLLRAAGIYGPGRVPNRKRLESQEPLPFDPDSWLNLIHVEDLVRVIDAVAARQPASQLYNVSDGCPVQRQAYYGYLSDLLGLPRPRFSPPEASTSPPRRGSASKRIDASRLQREMPVEFRFPSYREGLSAEFSNG